ncbi:hypothetical protein [Bacillus cereus]|uniref:hypothetical protein n=1 Tax=Bacillus cereus TaxID=1396 RepID=UPI000942B3E1|nr:hypothetical protein [Bacillus cereus]
MKRSTETDLLEKVLKKKILNDKISNQREVLKDSGLLDERDKIKLENSIKNLEDKRDTLTN